jgi:hypothetical protein
MIHYYSLSCEHLPQIGVSFVLMFVFGSNTYNSKGIDMLWEIFSPDLTHNDINKMGPSGGPVSRDNTGTEFYCTIFAFAESPIQGGLFWTGSDDGVIHISHDGKSWKNVTLADLPEWSLISIIEPSPHDPATAYIAANRYKWDDFQPYLYKTNDYGATELYEDLSQRIDMQLQRLKEVIDTDVAAFNQLMSESGVPAIIPISIMPVKR